MFPTLCDFTGRPAPFSRSTAQELWTRPHLARQMLTYHLDQETELASRPITQIEAIADWLDEQLPLDGAAVCDLGCGPGLYAEAFARREAAVTGVDVSVHSLDYAREAAARSGSGARYIQANYLADPLPGEFDIVTLIYHDFCVLSPLQRRQLLENVRGMLHPGGHFVFDVLGMAAFSAREERTVIERRLMNGFWAAGDYVGLQQTLLYPEEAISLDRYLIVEPGERWEIFNWFQYFTAESITRELAQAGFTVATLAGSLAGAPLRDVGRELGIFARR